MTSTASAPFDKNGVLDRVFAVERRVAVIVRVSSPKQIKNDGSLETQRRQATLIERLFRKDQIDVFEILAESAREGARRPKFDAFLEELNSGAYGLVVVVDFDRLTRNGKDEARLLEVMKWHNSLLPAKGVLYDPTDHTEELIWRVLSLIAAYENALRSFRAILARAAKANNGRLAVTLPAGLGWYDPEDASYQTAASALDLQP